MANQRSSNFRGNDVNTSVVAAYQSALIYACLDDFTPSSALHNLHGGMYGGDVARWKEETLEFLYRNLATNLIEVSPIQSVYREMSYDDLCRNLNLERPYSVHTKTVSTLWVSIYFSGTSKLENIVAQHGLLDWKFFRGPNNQAFLEDVLDIYREHGVGMESRLLLPGGTTG